ncbi:methyltransferase family protein [Pseudooceanicola pacificus]|nr:isoprenylcysteine carboxylmethyltransferase family protein [Pseudooceanicola pacificus]
MKWIDMPPVWLASFLALAWAQKRWLPSGLDLGEAWPAFLGGLLVGGGVLLLALAAMEIRRHRTTIIPRREASALVTTGIYRRSRNPIYLGDTMILLGMICYWEAILSLALVPVFVWSIEMRFIVPEEDHLRRKFRMDFARYCQNTRRWV